MTPDKPSRIRLLLVDDHALVRSGLRMLVESRAGIAVVGEAQGAAEAVALARQQQPDIILLDLDLAGESGLSIIPDLLQAAPGSRLLVLTGVRDLEAHQQAFASGAMGLVHKEQAATVLLKAIEKVHAGEMWIDRAMAARVIGGLSRAGAPARQDPEAAKILTLSRREREVIALIGEGLPNKRIAERLFVSEATVRHHLTSIFSKLDVSDRLELLVYAHRHRLIENPGG